MNPRDRLSHLAGAVDVELREHILPYWYQTMDRVKGGFFGHVADDGAVDPSASKGLVMHSRHLWASSSAWMERRNPLDRLAAQHAFDFLSGPLHDEVGGFWWTVDANGSPESENKVVYGQAFAIYGLAQYHRATGDPTALRLALDTFTRLEAVGRDREFGGYYEAVDREWTHPLIQALSDVDTPCSKSMNTNLHVLEAYSTLFQATDRAEVREALESLLQVFERHILVTPEHLGLYFDRDWKPLTDHVSYGHDIEASWLLTEAAQLVGRSETKAVAVTIAQKTLALVREHGAMPNETHRGHLDADRIWWVQAETLVGLVNAWELTGDPAFLDGAELQWAFIRNHVIDRDRGEWFWLVDAEGRPDRNRPKGGLWKTSYHNGRACLEVIHRARAQGR